MSGGPAARRASPRRHRRRAGARRAARRRAGARRSRRPPRRRRPPRPTSTSHRRSPSSARTPTRNIAWSSTMHRPSRAWPGLWLSHRAPPRLAGRRRRTSVPSPGRRPDLGRAAVAVHAVDDAAADAHTGPPGRRPGRTRRRGRGRRPRPRPAVTSAYTSTLPVPACLAALTTASRVALTSGAQPLVEGAVADGRPGRRRRRGRPRPPRPIAAQGAGEGVGRPCSRPSNSQARRSRSCDAGQPGDGGRVARRSSGSAPGSAAPSRAGGRPCRHAPGCAPARRAPRSGRRPAGRPTGRRRSPRPRTPSGGRQQELAGRRRSGRSRSAKTAMASTIRSGAGGDPRVRPPSRREPNTIRTGSIRPVESTHRSRCASSAWRHSRAMPTIAISSGQNTAPPAEEPPRRSAGAPKPSAASAIAGPDVDEPAYRAAAARRRGWRSRGRARLGRTARRRAAPARGRRTSPRPHRRAPRRPRTPPAPTAPGGRGARPGRRRRRRSRDPGCRGWRAGTRTGARPEVGSARGRRVEGGCLAHRASIVADAPAPDHEARP